jgi:AbiTii
VTYIAVLRARDFSPEDRNFSVGSDGRIQTVQLIADIINLAVSNKNSASDLLRRCLVLAYELDNSKFKLWVDKELDGYEPKIRFQTTEELE